MALPIVVTVGALGLGFLALSRSRAGMVAPPPIDGASQATPDSTPTIREHGAAPMGTSHTVMTETVTGHPEGGGTIDPNQGTDPTTTPSGGGITGDAYQRPTTPVDATPSAPVVMLYGQFSHQSGITRYQESRAMQENGPAQGMVW
jgi:hypothetical protein